MRLFTQFFSLADGARIAYATMGQGPPLVLVPPFLSHLEIMWEAPPIRAFHQALAAHFTLVRYDRYGCGLSDQGRTDFSLAVDVRVLAALVDHLRLRRFALLGASAGGPVALHYAVDYPRRVSHLLLYGVRWRPAASAPVRAAVNALIRADQRVGINAYADLLLPGADAEAVAWFARIMREAASAEAGVALNEITVPLDLSDLLPRILVPTLVMNARGDRSVPLESARELAARIPGARFAAVPGDIHPLGFAPAEPIVQAICDFVGVPSRPPSGADDRDRDGARGAALGLSAREEEVLRLLAGGLRNREIAARLSLSVHTVERHIVNIYTKLGVRGRSEATAYALGHRQTDPGGSA